MFDKNIQLDNIKNSIYSSKKYLMGYLIAIVIISLILMNHNNYLNPKFEILIILFLLIIGLIFIISYPNHIELYKLVFLMILCFGIISSFLSPFCIVPDEQEHLVRSEITSRGVLIPQYHNNSFETIQSVNDIISNQGNTFLTSDLSTTNINNSQSYYHSAFAQNPFFGYIFQALGIILAKLLDLSSIWILYFGRIMNCLLYAFLAMLAIKISPILKVQLSVVACMPLAIFQIASLSIDSTIFGFALLGIAYFLFMFKSQKESLDYKNVLIFIIICLILGLSKLPYLAFILLLLFIPKENYKGNNYYILCILSIGGLLAIGLLWNHYYASPNLLHSFRQDYCIANNVSQVMQLGFMKNHITNVFIMLFQFPNYFIVHVTGLWIFSYSEYQFSSDFLKLIYFLFIFLTFCFNRCNEKYSLKFRAGIGIICLIIFYATYIIQLLCWTPVGQFYPILGVQTRYFIPLFALIPFIFGMNIKKDFWLDDRLIIIISIFFMASFIILECAKFY